MVSILSKVIQTMTTADRPGRHVIARSAVIACLILACFSGALALDPSLDVSQYAHTAWKIRDGFTRGRITAIVQTVDGYIWLGTEFGLLRFDGVRNVLWQPPGGQQLPSGFIMSLLTTRDGALWIGTDKGVASWKDGRLVQYPEFSGHFIFALMEDSSGAVWVSASTLPYGKLCEIRNASVRCYGQDGTFGRGVANLYQDRSGNVWATTVNGLWRWHPGPPRFFSMPGESIGKQQLADDSAGGLLLGTDSGIKRFVDGRIETYRFPGPARELGGARIFTDRDGALWIGTSNGLRHVHQGKTDGFLTLDGLSGQSVQSIFEDREGNIWVATYDGLDRFRNFAIPTLSVKQGLSNSIVHSVLAVTDGSILFTTANILNRWKDGQIAVYERGAQGQKLADIPRSLFEDRNGRIWVVMGHGFGYLENDRFIMLDGVPGGVARSMAEDASGNLWIANQDAGLLKLFQGRLVQQTPWTGLGHQDFATSMMVDSLRGGLWLGFFQGGVAYFKDGKIQATYTTANGLGEGLVNDLRLDPDGTLWAATVGGLSRLKNNRIATLTRKNGLPCDNIQWVMHNNDSSWMYTACGIVRIGNSELERWTGAVDQNQDPNQVVRSTVFGVSDGIRSRSYPIGYSPQVTRSKDGKLWFPGYDGLNVLDPNNLSFNSLPPPVHIEQFVADRKTYEATSDLNRELRLPALIRDLEIHYTALSFVSPEKLLFRYKLEGHDRDWQDVGNRRQAFYNDLPPGNYRFRVMACNNSGVWNETGTFLDFTIPPAYYQTIWFRLLLLVGFLILVLVGYQLRVRQVAAQLRARMEERLDERERIARDLHDTFLQSVQGLILKFHAVATQIPPDQSAHAALERTLDHADRVLAEGRDRVRNLRAPAIPFGGLPVAFERLAREISPAGSTELKILVEGSLRELHPVVREESFCIGREAIVNALAHSGGNQIEVKITYKPQQFCLQVRDDGHGIAQKILEEGGRANHWGMQGMRERATKVGGQLKIASSSATGTEIELTIPGANAYRPITKLKFPWLRRFFPDDSSEA
jgi:ligand-binding sensor domain-containing protein/signal transduction histidine kinase